MSTSGPGVRSRGGYEGTYVDRCSDLVLVRRLQGVDDAEDFCGVAAGRGRVGEDGADLLVGIDNEDGADGEGDALLVDVGGVLVVDPVVGWGISCALLYAL